VRVTQEFYCGECVGYFLVRLNMALNFEAHIKCPNCGHEHRRVIKDGEIYEGGRYESKVKETVHTTKAQYSKQPYTQKMIDAKTYAQRRDAVPMDHVMAQRWLEIASDQTGDIR